MNMRLVHDRTESTPSQKDGMLDTLRGLLRETCRLRNEGSQYAKLAHAQGYADGYMKMLLDGGFVDQRELLSLITEVRRGVDGPATRRVTLDSAAVVA